MKQNVNKSTNSNLLIILIAILFLTIHQNYLLATDIDTILISEPEKLNIYNPYEVISSPQNGEKYARVGWDADSIDNYKNIYMVNGDKQTVFITDSFGINNITFLGKDLYYSTEGFVKGYNTQTMELLFQMLSPAPTLIFDDMVSVGDSLILASDSEWDCIIKFNVKTHVATKISTEGTGVLKSLCYDSFNNRIIGFHSYSSNIGLDIIDMSNDNKISSIDVDFDSWWSADGERIEMNFDTWLNAGGLTTDKRGNIFITCYKMPGVYLVDTNAHNLVQISKEPVNPGMIYYSKEEDCIFVPGIHTSELYTIWLSSNITTSTIENAHDELFDFKVFPNPSNGIVNISFDLSQPLKGSIDILSIDGKLVKHFPEQYWHEGNNLLIWDGEKLKAGIYQVQITGLKSNNIQKMVIIR